MNLSNVQRQFAAAFAPEWEDFGLPKRRNDLAEACAASLNKWSPMARFEFRVFPVGDRFAIRRRAR